MTDAYSVRYSPAALDDLKAIYSYIAFELKERSTAARQVDRIRKAIRSLDTMPSRYAAVDWEPWASMGMRKFPVNNYIVFYLVEEEPKQVTVVRIFYGGRNIEDIVRSESE